MELRKKSGELRVLECLAQVCLAYPIIVLVWYMFANEDMINLQVFAAVFLSEALLYILRYRINKKWLYILATAVFMALAFAVGYLTNRIYFFAGFIASIMGLIKIYAEERTDLEIPRGITAFIFVFIGICVWLSSDSKLTAVFYAFEAAYILILFVYNSFLKADKFIWENRRTSFLSVSKIKNANYLNVAAMVVIISAVAVITALMFTPLLNLLRWPIMWLIHQFVSADTEVELQGGFEEATRPDKIGEYNNTGKDFSALPSLVLIAAIVFAVFIVIVLIVLIIRSVIDSSKGKAEDEVKEFVFPFGKKEKSHDTEKVKGEDIPSDMRPSKKIRRIYKKKIRDLVNDKAVILKSSTPEEQCEIADITHEDSEAILELYYKARYSNKECTEKDVQKMKECTDI